MSSRQDLQEGTSEYFVPSLTPCRAPYPLKPWGVLVRTTVLSEVPCSL